MLGTTRSRDLLLMAIIGVMAALAQAQMACAEGASTLVDVFNRNDGVYPQYRIPALLVSAQGTLLAFAEARQAGDHSENDIVLRRSFDNGKTWGEQQLVIEMGGDSLNDPCAVVVRETGRILLLFQRFPQGYHTIKSDHTEMAKLGYGGPRNTQSFLTHSDDDGATWSEPRDITQSIRAEDAIAVGSPGVGIQLSRGAHRGRILIPLYETFPLQDGQRSWRTRVAISDDGGESWRLGARVPHEGLEGHDNECQLAELADGAVLLSARNQGGKPCRKSAVSRDAGESWEPMRENPDLVTPACMGSIVRHTWPEAGQSRLVVSLPNTEKSRRNGVAFVSLDEGATWEPKQVIYERGFAYSCLAVLPNGKVACLFERDGYRHISFTVLDID